MTPTLAAPVRGAGPVSLETNPQGGWMFLTGADVVVPVLADHLRTPVRTGAANAELGKWPKALARFGADMLPKAWAPAHGGVQAPVFARPPGSTRSPLCERPWTQRRQPTRQPWTRLRRQKRRPAGSFSWGWPLLTPAFAVGAYELSFALRRPRLAAHAGPGRRRPGVLGPSAYSRQGRSTGSASTVRPKPPTSTESAPLPLPRSSSRWRRTVADSPIGRLPTSSPT